MSLEKEIPFEIRLMEFLRCPRPTIVVDDTAAKREIFKKWAQKLRSDIMNVPPAALLEQKVLTALANSTFLWYNCCVVGGNDGECRSISG